MVKILQQIYQYLSRQNKYVITGLAFGAWVLFFDQNNLFSRLLQLRQLSKLEEEKQYYVKKIQADSAELYHLKHDADNLERVAREQYLMKKKNEEIFIMVEK